MYEWDLIVRDENTRLNARMTKCSDGWVTSLRVRHVGGSSISTFANARKKIFWGNSLASLSSCSHFKCA